MMKVFAVLLSGLLMCVSSLVAQSVIRGTVRNRTDRRPLPGVNVTIKNTPAGVSTGKEGKYEFGEVPAGKIEIVFSCIGLKTVTRQVVIGGKEVRTLDIFMEEDDFRMEGVEVVGVGERKEIRDVKRQGVPVTVIDGKMLAGRGTTISEVLNLQRDINIRPTGGAGRQA